MASADPNVTTTFIGDATLVKAAAQQATAAVEASAKAQAAAAERSAAAIEAAAARQSAAFQRQIAAAREAAAATLGGAAGGNATLTGSLKEAIRPASQFVSVLSRIGGIVAIVTGTIAGLVAGVKALADWLNISRKRAEEAGQAYGKAIEALDKIRDDRRSAGLSDEAKAIEKVKDKYTELAEQLLQGPLNLDTSPQGKLRFEAVKKRIEDEQQLEIDAIRRTSYEKAYAAQTAEADKRHALEREARLTRAHNKQAADEYAANLADAAAKKNRDEAEAAQKLAAELAKAADTFAQKMRDAIQQPLEELRRLNEQFVNTQNSNLITSINRLADSLDAAGTGRFDGPTSGFLD